MLAVSRFWSFLDRPSSLNWSKSTVFLRHRELSLTLEFPPAPIITGKHINAKYLPSCRACC